MPARITTANGEPRPVRTAQQTWANGVTAATAPTLNIVGKVVQIETKGVCADEALTWTVTITTSNGATLFTKVSIPEGATVYDTESSKGTLDADFNPFYATGVVTITITPSGDPGASGATFDLVLTIV